MLWFPEWKVLVVDDDPDVLQITELALRNVEVEGVPVKVYTASSKAEAIEVLNTHMAEPGGLGLLTVALIDVVMETDTAGLELCDYIRNTMGNSTAQLYIRTGQPGIAPERGVIDDYDITGYFTKVEATEDKLYTMVKSGVRQFVLTTMSGYSTLTINEALNAAQVSQDEVGSRLGMGFGYLIQQRGDKDSGIAMWVGDTLLLNVGLSPDEANALRAKMANVPAVELAPSGENVSYLIDERLGSVRVPAGPNNLAVEMTGRGHSLPRSNYVFLSTAWSLRAIGMVWESAGQRAFAE
jgi:CheY-like chemotaxis protein